MDDGRLVWIDWQGRRRPRRDVILELHAGGMSIADIARRLETRYQIVRQTVLAQPVRPPSPPAQSTPVALDDGPLDGILVGCVSQKHARPLPAKDLYRSELFRRRRLYAEAFGRPWWIVSAEYGLVDPDRVIAPYDTRIATLPLARRQALAEGVALDLEQALGTLTGRRLELHAGDDYALAISPTLRGRGAQIVRPLEGLRIGEQLAWYGQRLGLRSASSALSPQVKPPAERESRLGDAHGLGRRLSELFVTGQLDLSARPGAPTPGWDGMPEVIAANRLREIGADDVAVRRFLTFNAAMDRARDADRLAEAGVGLYQRFAWVYDPPEVVRRPVRDLADALRASGVSQRHSVDSFGWRLLAETLADSRLAPAAHAVIYEGEADARALLTELTRVSLAGTPYFPLLGGPKVGPLWIRLMAHPGAAHITSLEVVPVAVDVQVRKVSEYLGATATAGLPLEDVRAVIQAIWARDVATHGAAGPGGLRDTPGALDPALWFYGKWGCTFCERAAKQLPISELCADCRFARTASE